jgi:flavorubredoxin
MEVNVHLTRLIAPNIYFVGVNDKRLDRFENMFALPQGVAYNSYLIKDEKTALLDTVDSSVTDQFLDNIKGVLQQRELDYLIINHMEPDHCGSIEAIVRLYPKVKLVGNKKTFDLFKQFYAQDIEKNIVLVKEGDVLDLGTKKIKFYMAPMVHWPEVMFSYELSEDILFSADAFGSFGTHNGNLFADESDWENLFLDETRRYYSNIVGRYGSQVESVFKKLEIDKIKQIFPLHGPLWRKDLKIIFDKYTKWSSYRAEKNGVVIFYASMYGNTEHAAQLLANKLAIRGVEDMRLYDVSKTESSYIIADIFKYSHFVAASPTYNMQLYPVMEQLLRELIMLNVQNRSVAIIGNHSWASAAVKQMVALINQMKNVELIGQPIDIRSSVKEQSDKELEDLADQLAKSVLKY